MLAGHGMPAEGFLRHRGLIALAIGGAVTEACLLTIFAPAARPMAPQITALPPLAIFHDLRWLFGYNRSWYGFELAYGGLVFGQAAISTVMMRLAWPREHAMPTWAATFGRCVIFTVIASVLLSPVVTLLFGVSLLPFSWPFLAALPALLLILIPLAHGGLRGSWWRTLPPARAIGWLLGSFIVLSGAAAAMASLPAAAAIAVAGLAGLINARAWYGLAAAVTSEAAPGSLPGARAWRRHPGRNARIHAEPDPAPLRPAERRPWPAPLSPLAAAVGLALLVGTTRLVFAVAGTTPLPGGPASIPTRAAAMAAAAPAGRSDPKLTDAVLVIPGFGSSCCYPSRSRELIGPSALVRPFSYAGLDAQGRPLPYGNDATDLPLPVLGDRIAQQVAQLHKETGRPVDIVAESEGTLGVYAMLARHPGLPLGSIVLLSPIVDPGQADQSVAPGQGGDPVSGKALSELVRFAGALSPFGESGAEDLIQSVRNDGAAYAAAAMKNGQRIHWLAVIPMADALTLPVCDLPANVIVVNALHGSLLGDDAVDRLAHRFLSDQKVDGQQQLRDTAQVIAAAASAWRMPAIGTGPPCSG
ncbi:MAG TPA: hypothetical protein VMC03_13370 [Streptosporangiaceae bacterium]|nr:hypothetical protein [Streptosporangiaceae bacterium]